MPKTHVKPLPLLNPADLTAETLSAIDGEFWDGVLHLASDAAAPDAALSEIFATLLRPLGAIKTPDSLDCAVLMYRQLRAGAERRFDVRIAREAEHHAIGSLTSAGYHA